MVAATPPARQSAQFRIHSSTAYEPRLAELLRPSRTVRALRLRRRWLLVAVVLFDADDAALREEVVGHAPSAHTRPSRPRSGIGGELPAPAHSRYDGVAAGDVVANLVRLPGQQLASRLEPSAHRRAVAIAPARVDQVRPLGEADVGTE